MGGPEAHLIFVNQRPYRIWSGVSHFRTEDFLQRFDPLHHVHLGRLLESGLDGEAPDPALLGIRTVHGLATEAFFALLFALLQAPEAPAAWFLLYRPGDIEELTRRFESGERLPSRINPDIKSWQSLAQLLIPIDDEESVQCFGTFWKRLAADYRNDQTKQEFNSLKHGLRARAGSPYVAIGGHELAVAEHGSSFPVVSRRKTEVVLSFGSRSWSARSLLAELELLSASMINLLTLLKQLHGLEKHLEFEVPEETLFEAAEPPKTQVLSSLAFKTNWPPDGRLEPLDKNNALASYEQLGKLSWAKR